MNKEPEKFPVPETLRLKALLKGLDGRVVAPKHLNREAILLDTVRHLLAVYGEDETASQILGWLQ